MILNQKRSQVALFNSRYKRGIMVTLSYIPDPEKYDTLLVYKQGHKPNMNPVTLSMKVYGPIFDERFPNALFFVKMYQQRFERRTWEKKGNVYIEENEPIIPKIPCEWYSVRIADDQFIYGYVWPS